MPPSVPDAVRLRNLFYLRDPTRWPCWPFLPLVRRRAGQPEEYGLLVDTRRLLGVCGLSATVYLTNLFLLPASLDSLLALPKETFDTPEEIAAAGWLID